MTTNQKKTEQAHASRSSLLGPRLPPAGPVRHAIYYNDPDPAD